MSYLAKNKYQRVLMIKDTNQKDRYAATLGEAFQREYRARFGENAGPYTLEFTSPDKPLNDISRAQYMTKAFAQERGEICQYGPDLIYFAGRGADMAPFLQVLTDQWCGLPRFDLLTSDDATSIVGTRLDSHGQQVKVLYTGMGTRRQWDPRDRAQHENAGNYDNFESAFKRFGRPDEDLADGYAMSNHDAVLLAAEAARKNPSPIANPTMVADWIRNFNCATPFLGATGKIAFSRESHGNPINKAMPIMQLHPDGRPQQLDLVWSDEQPFDVACR